MSFSLHYFLLFNIVGVGRYPFGRASNTFTSNLIKKPVEMKRKERPLVGTVKCLIIKTD